MARDGAAPEAIAFDDYSLQFYYGQLGSRFLREGGVTYGYDPSFMAGYVKMPLYYPSSKPFEFALHWFSGASPARVFNTTVFAMVALLPFLMWGAAWNLGFSAGERLAVVALCLAPYQLVPFAGFYSIMEAAGMVPYVFACFLSVFTVTLFARFLTRGGRWAAAGLLVCAPLLAMTHLMAPLVSAVPLVALFLASLRDPPWRRYAWLLLVGGAVLALNWPWIEGYLRFSHYGDVSAYYTPEGRRHFVPQGGWLAPLHASVPSPALYALVPPLFGALGLFAWWRAGRRDALVLFLPQVAALFVVTYYGAHLGLAALSPGRVTLPLGLYLILAAAHGLAVAGRALWRRIEGLPRRDATLAKAAAAAALAGVVLASGLPAKLPRPYALPALEASNGYTRKGRGLAEWLRTRTTPEGRILHEETPRNLHAYYGTHMPAMLPFYTGREFANGPAPHPLVKTNYLRFVAGSLRGRPLAQVSTPELKELLSLYNVGWVLCWSAPCKGYFTRQPIAAALADYDKFRLFEIRLPASFFLRGSGRVEASPNRIVLRDVEPQDGAIVLKYHWLESLRSDPPRALDGVHQGDDPVPFIRIEDPPRELVIYGDSDFAPGGRRE